MRSADVMMDYSGGTELSFGDGEGLFEPGRLSESHVAAEWRELVRPAPLVFVATTDADALLDQPILEAA